MLRLKGVVLFCLRVLRLRLIELVESCSLLIEIVANRGWTV